SVTQQCEEGVVHYDSDEFDVHATCYGNTLASQSTFGSTIPDISCRLISFRIDNLLSRICRVILSLQKCKVSRPSWASFAPRCLARMSSESVFRLLQQSSLCLGY